MLTVERKRKIAVILPFSQNNLVLEKSNCLKLLPQGGSKSKQGKSRPSFHTRHSHTLQLWSTSGIAKKDKEFLKCLAKKHSKFKMSKITQAADV